MTYMRMIHCVCLNRAQQWLTAMCLLFSAASEGRIRNLGLGGKIRTFLGPFLHFNPIWDQFPNLGPYRSPWLFIVETAHFPLKGPEPWLYKCVHHSHHLEKRSKNRPILRDFTLYFCIHKLTANHTSYRMQYLGHVEKVEKGVWQIVGLRFTI